MSATAQLVPGLKRIDLQEHDLSVPGRVVIQNRIELSSEAPAFRCKHPAEELTYVVDRWLFDRRLALCRLTTSAMR